MCAYLANKADSDFDSDKTRPKHKLTEDKDNNYHKLTTITSQQTPQAKHSYPKLTATQPNNHHKLTAPNS